MITAYINYANQQRDFSLREMTSYKYCDETKLQDEVQKSFFFVFEIAFFNVILICHESILE